jgi:hypothetical protein
LLPLVTGFVGEALTVVRTGLLTVDLPAGSDFSGASFHAD